MSKKVTLDGKDILGGGAGSWAKSRERGVVLGDVRFIGGILMYAQSIHPHLLGLVPPTINWTPVDKNLARDYSARSKWISNLQK